jgi:ATP/maltotriose-dependent transcriptional regulator MalT
MASEVEAAGTIVLNSISLYLESEQFQMATALLLSQRDYLRAQVEPSALLEVLGMVPVSLLQQTPELLMLLGHSQQKTGNMTAAAASLERARMLYLRDLDSVQAAQSAMELARLYHQAEDLGMARLYIKLATRVLDEGNQVEGKARAGLLLGIASLAPDIGLYKQGEKVALQALHLYEEWGDTEGCFDAIFLLFSFTNQTGRTQKAGSYLTLLQQRVQSGELDLAYEILALNCAAHWHWYRGDLAQGLAPAREAIALADAHHRYKQQIYNRLVLGNLYRGIGAYAEADLWYKAAKERLRAIGFTLFEPWIDVQRAWLLILQEEFPAARQLIHSALKSGDRGQVASFQIFLAVLNSLTQRYVEATRLLDDSLAFYKEAGDPLTRCAIHFHLCYIHLQTGERSEAQQILFSALKWLSKRNLDCFPHWWHPSIVASVCAFALEEGLYPELAERILVQRIGRNSIAAVDPLRSHHDPSVRRRAQDVLALLGTDPLHCLRTDMDKAVRRLLEEMIAANELLPEGLAHLSTLLTTADVRGKPNPTLIAVFGLLLRGTPHKSIAVALGLAQPTVRNYISLIYDIFGIPYQPGRPKERLALLMEQARAQGLVPAGRKL